MESSLTGQSSMERTYQAVGQRRDVGQTMAPLKTKEMLRADIRQLIVGMEFELSQKRTNFEREQIRTFQI